MWESKCARSPLSFNIFISLSWCSKMRKEMKDVKMKMEETKLFLFVDDEIVYVDSFISILYLTGKN